MGMGDADSAAIRMRLIEAEFTTPRRTGDSGRRARSTEPAAPVDLGILAYMQASVDEVVSHTRAAAPDAPPPPATASAVYHWMDQNTAHLDAEKRQAAEVIVYRQALEHALAVGDESVVRRHPCPDCGCWGLFWRASARRAACVNRHCSGEGQAAHTFTLAQLARRHVASRESAVRRAT
ncbi:hypothetical protein ABZ383_27375 [Streptomyces sp. NPDC005900]|uniref:hypothetical protein n=1 Tax=Streptomyces sp. NPDC005900 TaxID=3154569 RepID=UPI0033E83A12